MDRRRVGKPQVLQRAEELRVEVELEPVGDVGARVEIDAVHDGSHPRRRIVVVVHLPTLRLGVALGLRGGCRRGRRVRLCSIVAVVVGGGVVVVVVVREVSLVGVVADG